MTTGNRKKIDTIKFVRKFSISQHNFHLYRGIYHIAQPVFLFPQRSPVHPIWRNNSERHGVTPSTSAHFAKLKWKILQHPLYSPDLALLDYHFFVWLKGFLDGQKFTNDEELQRGVQNFSSIWMHSTSLR